MVTREWLADLGGLRRRVLATLGLFAIYGVLNAVPLPGLDSRQAAAAGESLSLLAIGIGTSTSAFVMVEVAALLWPRWRRLRLSFVGRAKLERAVAITTVALGAMQVFGVVLAIQHLNDVDAKIPLLTGKAEALVGLSLYLGVICSFFLARTISRLGLVNGFSVVSLLQAARLLNGHDIANAHADVLGTRHPWLLLGAVALPVAATAVCFSARRAGRREPGALAPFELPIPASSMQPVAIVVGLLGMPDPLASFHSEAMRSLVSWSVRFDENPLLWSASTVSFGLLLLWAFARPRSVSAAFSRAVDDDAAAKLARRAFRDSIAPTLLFLLTLSLSELLLTRFLHILRLAPLLPAGVAVGLDLLAAVRVHGSGEWACAWRDPRPYAFPVVQRLLRRSDIVARELCVAQTTLFRVFSPFVLTEVWVPVTHAQRATELIEAAFSVESVARADPELVELDEALERAARRKRLYQLAALAAVAGAATASVMH